MGLTYNLVLVLRWGFSKFMDWFGFWTVFDEVECGFVTWFSFGCMRWLGLQIDELSYDVS